MNYVNISNDQFCFYRYETKAVKWIYLYIFREQPHAQLGCIWKMLHWHIKACLVESVFGHLPTHEAWVMPNLISIDFYIEGEPNAIYPLGCMQHFFFFQGNVLYLSWPQKLSLGRTAKRLLSQCPWNTKVPICYFEALCTRICSQVIRDWKSAGHSSRGSSIRGPHISRAYVYMAGGEPMRGQYKPPGKGQE